jgi:hypothetical protein
MHPWWWRQYAPLKRRPTIILHGSTSQKTIRIMEFIDKTINYKVYNKYASLMMEAVRTSETSADNHFTRQYIPEDNSNHGIYWQDHKL